jgi:hypothetical protein
MRDLAYEYIAPEGKVTRHMWTLVGPTGAVHIWAEPNDPNFAARWNQEYYGGIEIHSPTRLYSFGDGKPDHDPCWLLNAPCWHDGSSLQFSEQVEPFIRHATLPFGPHVHEFINSILFEWYQSRFKAEEVA